MILSRPLIRAVLRGDKTQHRQPRRPAHNTGKSIAIRPPDAPGDGTRIRITNITPVTLGDVTFEQARAEGYRTTRDYTAAWVCQHDRAWLNQGVPVPCDCPTIHNPGDHFRLREPTDHDIARRFQARHANRIVWLIEFELDPTQADRFISVGWPDYTTSLALAAPGEPQPVDDVDQCRITERAGSQYAQWKALELAARDRELEQLSLGRRLDRALDEARADGRSVTREIRVIEQRLRALERAKLPHAA